MFRWLYLNFQPYCLKAPQFLGILLVSVAIGFSLYYLWVAIMRVFYPYDLDFIEDAMLLQAYRFAQHEPVFLPPNAVFVPQVYTPLYTWLGGLLFRLTGPAFWPLRLLSLLATLGTAVLIAAITHRESRQWRWGLIGVGLFLAGHRLMGGWYELARVDSLYIFLALAGMTVAVYRHKSCGALAIAGLLMGLSFLSKQSGLFLATVVGLYLFLVVGWRVVWYGGTLGLITAVPLLWWQWQSNGWFFTYVFDIAYASPIEWRRVIYTLQNELFGGMGGVLCVFLALSVWLFNQYRWQSITKHPWVLFIATSIFITVAGRASVGGNLNNLIPGYVFLCLVPGLWVAEFSRHSTQWGKQLTAVLPLFLLVQFYLTQFNPAPNKPDQVLPTMNMQAAGDQFIQRLKTSDGKIWVMMHPYYALLAGQSEPGVHIQSLWHARHRGQDPFPADLVAQIQNQEYVMIISDESLYFEMEPALQTLLNTYYQRSELLPEWQSPSTLSGILVRPLVVYVPR